MPATGSAIGYDEAVLVSSAARATSGDSGILTGYGGASTLRVQSDVTAASGTVPTLDVLVEDTLDGTNWNKIGSFAQKAAAGREVIDVTTPFAERLRVRWTIGGTTPSFTFSVSAVSQSPGS